MKTKLLVILSIAAIMCSGCDTIEMIEEKDYAFFIFQYTDESNKDLIITSTEPDTQFNSWGAKVINGIYNYPKRYKDEPYYSGEQWYENPEKYTFDICELSTNEKLLALHDNYYTYFPYTNIVVYDQFVVRDSKWEKICDSNPQELPILGSAGSWEQLAGSPNALYKEIRLFEIRQLEKLTGKSRTEMTIGDIESAVNKVIDDGKLDKYSKTYNNMWGSRY